MFYFSKMQATGNDFIIIDYLENNFNYSFKLLSKYLCDRHFGIGSDGLILIKPSDKADFTMEMYNVDGSQSEMCGNGIRCVGKYVYDYGLTDKEEISVETLAGIKYLKFVIDRKDESDRGTVAMVTVHMGEPIFKPAEVPVNVGEELDIVQDYPVNIDGETYNITCVSMGNPHCITYVEDTDSFPLEEVGPKFESNPIFPRRVNAEFVQIVSRTYAKMRVWERGSGETLACGTGCCATAAACVLNGLTENEITVEVLGGKIQIEWNREENLIYMTGPAETIFDGEVEV